MACSFNEVIRAVRYALEKQEKTIEGSDLTRLDISIWFDKRTGAPGNCEVRPAFAVPPERESAKIALAERNGSSIDQELTRTQAAHLARLKSLTP